MDSITRNVTDIDQADRHALEHVIGQHLREDQQVVISVLNVDMSKPLPAHHARPKTGFRSGGRCTMG